MEGKGTGTSLGELSAEARRRIEDELYRVVLARVLRTMLIASALVVGSIVLVGWLSWSALRRRLAESAVATLQADDSLRSELWAGLGIDTAAYARLLESMRELEGLTRGAGERSAGNAELERMLEALLGELSTE